MSVGMQMLKSFPTTTAITEWHYTPASRPIPGWPWSTQNINRTICGKNIGKSTSIRPAAFALVSVVFFFFFKWGVTTFSPLPASPPPPSLISNHKPSPLSPQKVTSQLRKRIRIQMGMIGDSRRTRSMPSNPLLSARAQYHEPLQKKRLGPA